MSFPRRSKSMCIERTLSPAARSCGATLAPNGSKVSTSSKPQALTCFSVPGTSFGSCSRRL
jgi:hypothetical protein